MTGIQTAAPYGRRLVRVLARHRGRRIDAPGRGTSGTYLENLPDRQACDRARALRASPRLETLAVAHQLAPGPALAEDMAGQTCFGNRKGNRVIRRYGDSLWSGAAWNEVLGMNGPDLTRLEVPANPGSAAGAAIYEMDQGNMVDWPQKSAPFDPSENSELVAATARRSCASASATNRPHDGQPPLRYQEAEAVACIHKQMANGSYTYGAHGEGREAPGGGQLNTAKEDGGDAAGLSHQDRTLRCARFAYQVRMT